MPGYDLFEKVIYKNLHSFDLLPEQIFIVCSYKN